MKRKLIVIAIYLTVPLLAAVSTYVALDAYFLKPFEPANQTSTIFEVTSDKRFRQVAEELERSHLVRHQLPIRLLAKFQKKDTLVMAGEYEFSPSMTPQQILDAMVEGKMILRRITIKEGASLKEIAPLLEEAGIISRDLFDRAVTDPALLEEFKIPGSSFEGYLFPETYRIQRNTAPKKVLQILNKQLESIWEEQWNLRLMELSLTKHEILTLASIIEKESGNVDEQPLIASVFHNRLNRGMRLQADPTVIYGIQNFNGNITKNDLTTPTPYNTYVIAGLPPGPIANPGRNAIKAALYPASSNYLFFVGNGKGRHIFSETLDDHNNAVNTFQRGQAPDAPSNEQPPLPSDTLPDSATPIPPPATAPTQATEATPPAENVNG